MDPVATPPRISRVDSRYRHRAQNVPPQSEPVPQSEEKEEESSQEDLIPELRARDSMSRGHRFFHRRAALGNTKVVTVAVEVVGTVDTSGSFIPQETMAPVTPQSPDAPALPTAAAVAAPSPAPAPSVAPAAQQPLPSAPSPGTASLFSSSSFISLDSISASTATDLIATIADAPTRSTSSSASQFTSSSDAPSSSQTSAESAFTSSAVISSDAASTTAYYGGAGGDASGTAAAPAATTAGISDADADTAPSPLETPQVVGSVVGSLAGAALILAIILLLLRRHKRKQGGALQLTGDDHTDNNQSMRQAPTTASTLAPIAFLNRFSGLSGKTAETNLSGGERSFQRVSGRKLPSAFSEGMTSDQFSRGGTMSGSSFYQDEHGTYGGPGMSKEFGKEIGDSPTNRESGPMNIRPSPARTPVIRHPDDGNPFSDRNYLSPPQSPNPDAPPRGTLGRSLPSADGSRSSRFTENV
ncbi:hypothetical protein J4E90_001920 [Alternaria incomplexa]|uniref:uncharacterized protein n=1 Tax=Alternaria incomplexa TaxID=1187928 RepID=UPI00221F4121|nr:uncharacterized protein J4E90_001920 [Alternaria incomplexa]KAI4919783.1 hypothetical protein J4E90_001920 [Alternaria incomplexa]